MSMLEGRVQDHIACASYKQEWLLRSLIIPHRMVIQSRGYLLRYIPEWRAWGTPHQPVCYSACLTVLNCERKSSVWAHTGTFEEWALLREKPAINQRKDIFHQVLYPVSSKATTRHVLWTFGSVWWVLGRFEGKVWLLAFYHWYKVLAKYSSSQPTWPRAFLFQKMDFIVNSFSRYF